MGQSLFLQYPTTLTPGWRFPSESNAPNICKCIEVRQTNMKSKWGHCHYRELPTVPPTILAECLHSIIKLLHTAERGKRCLCTLCADWWSYAENLGTRKLGHGRQGFVLCLERREPLRIFVLEEYIGSSIRYVRIE